MPVAKRAKSIKKELKQNNQVNVEKCEAARLVIERCCGIPKDNKEWALHMRAFERVWTLFPIVEFWRNSFKPWRKPYPMYAYTGETGKEYIKEQYEQYLVEKRELQKYNLEDKPVAEISTLDKPVSLLDFLKGNYPKENEITNHQ